MKVKKYLWQALQKKQKQLTGAFTDTLIILDEIHAAAIMQVVLNAAEIVDNQMKTEKSNLFKIYYSLVYCH